ncbi:MAG: SMC-Scp complex subunit ScpB [Oscillospiraceae bacterium]|jgi:segregation and condensation protein B|nr:SMC-Scp complex subunit ScpB [Oscillospiraceae bacterium]
MEYSELDEKLEAILFAVGDPSSLDDLMLACGADRRTVRGALDYLEKRLNITGGIRLLRLDGKYQLATKERFADNVKIALNTKRLVPITAAAAEVLAIIAYNQPVTKGFVERVREVNSDSVVNSLAEKELIEEAGRLPLPGRPMTYRTTSTF